MVILIIGLPGSGKTHLAKQIVAEIGAVLFDDPIASDLPELFLAIDEGKDVVIADPHFCRLDVLNSAIKMISQHTPLLNIDRIFFENDARTAIKNNARRNDGREISEAYIRTLSKDYVIPDGEKIRPVFSPENQ